MALSKEFETVNHTLLTEYLENIGIRGLPLKQLKSYIMNRTQKSPEKKSENRNMVYLMNPSLDLYFFNIYVNVFFKRNTSGSFHK